MEPSKKTKRVSWAPDEYLCQVKPVLQTDCPSRIGTIPSFYGPSPSLFDSSFAIYAKVYGNIWKEKPSKPRTSQSHVKNSHSVDRLKWKCPPKLNMRPEWQVAAGEESKEAEAQKQRETRELEVFYPQFSAIPLNPSVSSDIEDECYDDRQTPIVPIDGVEDMEDPSVSLDIEDGHYDDRQTPIVPIEDVNTVDKFDSVKPVSTSKISHPVLLAGADVVVAALAAMWKNKEQEALIDTNLLAEILSNPKIIEKLSDVNGVSSTCASAAKPAIAPVPISCMPEIENKISDQARPAQNNAPSAAVTPPMFAAKSVTEPVPFSDLPADEPIHSIPQPQIAPMSAHRHLWIPNQGFSLNPVFVPTQPNSVTKLQPTLGSMPAHPGSFPKSSYAAAVTANPTPRGLNYYHQLIKEYGGTSQEMPYCSILQPDSNRNGYQFQNMITVPNLKPEDSFTKVQKSCKYFQNSKGCKNGSKCLYRHDILTTLRAGSKLESPTVKKMKLY